MAYWIWLISLACQPLHPWKEGLVSLTQRLCAEWVELICNFIGGTGGARRSDTCTKMVYEWSQTLLLRLEGLARQTTDLLPSGKRGNLFLSHWAWCIYICLYVYMFVYTVQVIYVVVITHFWGLQAKYNTRPRRSEVGTRKWVITNLYPFAMAAGQTLFNLYLSRSCKGMHALPYT